MDSDISKRSADNDPKSLVQPMPRPRRRLVLLTRAVAIVVAVLLAVAFVAGVWVRGRLRGSLPQLDGEVTVAGLREPVVVLRDRLGVPTIRGGSRGDVARATGFLHAQERFFQMDLMRRQAAGTLAELFGQVASAWDAEIRVHRLRVVAREVVNRETSERLAVSEAYAQGVNQGLDALDEKPWEYIVLGCEPEPWTASDCALVLLAMFVELHDWTGDREATLGALHEALPEEMYGFLTPWGTEWDAPLEGDAFATPPIPAPEAFRVAAGGARTSGRAPGAGPNERASAGSNNWAMAGEHTVHGGSIVANDMHLGLRVPNTWYRASLEVTESGQTRRITGVTLPGTASVVAGSNSRVAWGLTNSYGDWVDLVIVDRDPHAADHYLAPGGSRAFEQVTETIVVKGGESLEVEVVSTIWGPVIGADSRGRPLAIRWTGGTAEAVDFNLLEMEDATTVEEALAVANSSGIPPQNFVCADADGRIAWTIMGRIPRRVGHDGRLPVSWSDGSRGWQGWLAPEEYPRVVDPPSGRLWSANARVVDGEGLRVLGDGGYALGARARQIRDGLLSFERVDEAGMLRLQLDDRALFLERWRDLLLALLGPDAVADSPRRTKLREHVEFWTGRAAPECVGYRMVRAFRSFVTQQVMEALTAACVGEGERCDWRELTQAEGPVWRLVTERPEHLLPPEQGSWESWLLIAVDATLEHFLGDGSDLGQHPWGERNTARIRHPLSAALPVVSRWLDMPADPLPGDSHMPRVQGPAFGASERMAVSPGREEHGILHMPCGQSGHPLSPFYGAGHAAWVRGEATPFLPGETVYELTLAPP